MSTTIALRHAALGHATSDVHAAARLLREHTLGARRQVAGLLADWQGGAADSFARAFDQWAGASTACIEALESIGAALALTDAELHASDAGARQALAHVADTLAGTLAGARR